MNSYNPFDNILIFNGINWQCSGTLDFWNIWKHSKALTSYSFLKLYYHGLLDKYENNFNIKWITPYTYGWNWIRTRKYILDKCIVILDTINR